MNTLYIHMAILGSSRSKGIIREGLYKGVDCEYIVLADINKSSGCTEGRSQTCKATSTHYFVRPSVLHDSFITWFLTAGKVFIHVKQLKHVVRLFQLLLTLRFVNRQV